jgi:hypothetical protein
MLPIGSITATRITKVLMSSVISINFSRGFLFPYYYTENTE